MSADNGLYIGHFSDGEFRVIHAQAIDNLWYGSPAACSCGHRCGPDANPRDMVEYFDKPLYVSKDATAALSAARKEADELYDEGLPLEYEISSLCFAHPFEWYREQAALAAAGDFSFDIGDK